MRTTRWWVNAADRYDSLFQFYADPYGLDWRMLKAQVQAESNFDPDALSTAGARGLAQFMPRTWLEWRDAAPGIEPPPADLLLDPRDPEDAIRAQAGYMNWLLDKFGDIRKALAAYNWGFGNVRRLQYSLDWYERLPQQTRDYVERISKSLGY